MNLTLSSLALGHSQFSSPNFIMSNKLAHIALSVLYAVLWMISKEVAAEQQCKAVESSVHGKALKKHTFKSVTVGDPAECQTVCEKDPMCQSYNFLIPRKLCELNDIIKQTSPQDFVSDENRFYMGIWPLKGDNS